MLLYNMSAASSDSLFEYECLDRLLTSLEMSDRVSRDFLLSVSAVKSSESYSWVLAREGNSSRLFSAEERSVEARSDGLFTPDWSTWDLLALDWSTRCLLAPDWSTRGVSLGVSNSDTSWRSKERTTICSLSSDFLTALSARSAYVRQKAGEEVHIILLKAQKEQKPLEIVKAKHFWVTKN